jgi:NADH-quinone oxidoreductase subunit F
MRETPLTRNIRPNEEPLALAVYEKAGGYAAVRRALRMDPKEVIDLVKASRLRGRGGAGFSTGTKWSFVPRDAPRPRYLVVNGDEMEPGTFKDRLLLEGDPHLLLEGIIVAAWAIRAEVAYVFLRWAYKRAASGLEKAIAEARHEGYLGRNILGSGLDLDVWVHTSAGRYMAGEETGLLNALQGRRARPRTKPPFPPVAGLWGKPTIVNNVETLANVPAIVTHGAQWYLDLSSSDDGGTKLYGASGHVRRPGLWELPLGATLGDVIEEHAGGMREGYTFKGALPGGASTDFLTAEHLDVKLDFDAVQKVGSRLGTGTIIVLDDRRCPVAMLRNLERFFAQESCGWCTPCREGLPWTANLLDAIERGQGEPGDLELLEMHARQLGSGLTFCALAPGAMEPLRSALRHFRGDFQRHIDEGECPWRTT